MPKFRKSNSAIDKPLYGSGLSDHALYLTRQANSEKSAELRASHAQYEAAAAAQRAADELFRMPVQGNA